MCSGRPSPDLADRIAAVALPSSSQQSARWAGYPELYRTGQFGAMDPTKPPSRFHIESGVPYFEAAKDGTLARHRLSEFEPGLFLAENGETLDLHGSARRAGTAVCRRAGRTALAANSGLANDERAEVTSDGRWMI